MGEHFKLFSRGAFPGGPTGAGMAARPGRGDLGGRGRRGWDPESRNSFPKQCGPGLLASSWFWAKGPVERWGGGLPAAMTPSPPWWVRAPHTVPTGALLGGGLPPLHV